MSDAPRHTENGGPEDEVGAAVSALYELTKELRRECPWDRAQSAATIVPHTVEETYEVVDAVHDAEAAVGGGVEAGAGREAGAAEAAATTRAALANLEDELGDLLFQVCFLAMWCQEHEPSIDLGSVARGIHAKLVRRHPHVFGDVLAETAEDVRGTWEQVKRGKERERGLFEGVPRSMPAVGRARKLQQRAASVGFDFPDVDDALAKLEEEVAELREAIASAREAGTLSVGESGSPDAGVVHEAGDVMFALINVARLTRVDPELALRATTGRFCERVAGAEELAASDGADFAQLTLDAQEEYYQRARARERTDGHPAGDG